jgi:septal ring factor EnvC (AmiA/AmiB activator)
MRRVPNYLLVGLFCLASSANVLAQPPLAGEVAELKREIARARAMIDKWQAELAALEQRLSRIEARLSAASRLRFPWEIERAMLGEGMERSLRQQLAPPRILRGGELSPNGSTAPRLPR